MLAKTDTIIEEVLHLKSYAPDERVNAIMGRFVHEVVNTSDDRFLALDSATIAQLQQVSSATETAMEVYWAERIIQEKERLDVFPYRANYRELVRRELSIMKETGLSLSADHTVLLIGSGPLPLTSLELHLQSGAHVHHVDPSATAIELSRAFNKSLGIDDEYFQATGQNVILSQKYDLVLIAALAGSNLQEKQQIVDAVLPHLSDNGRIIIRSAQGNREVLYPAIKAADLTGVTLLKEYHPSDEIINSVFVYGT